MFFIDPFLHSNENEIEKKGMCVRCNWTCPSLQDWFYRWAKTMNATDEREKRHLIVFIPLSNANMQSRGNLFNFGPNGRAKQKNANGTRAVAIKFRICLKFLSFVCGWKNEYKKHTHTKPMLLLAAIHVFFAFFSLWFVHLLHFPHCKMVIE